MIKKFFLFSVFLLLAGSIFILNIKPAKAMTAEEIRALIGQLQAQIQQLQQQLAQIEGQPQTWCHNFNVDLRIGMEGSEVEALQIALQKEGLYDKDITGNFDEYTASAVVGFQEKYASDILTPWRLSHGTGFVGKTTRIKLNNLYGCRGVTPPPITPPITPPTQPTTQGYDKCEFGGGWSEPQSEARYCGWPRGEKGYVKDCCCCYLTSHIHDLGGIFENKKVLIEYQPGWARGCSSEMTVYSSIDGENWNTVLTMPVTQEGWKATYTKIIDVYGKFRYIKIYIPKCYNDYSSAKVLGDIGETTKFITVLSPNGGERWEIGKTYTIKWTTIGYDSSASIQIGLRDARYDPNTSEGEMTIVNTTNSGSYNWTIPSTVKPTSEGAGPTHKIVIYIEGGGPGKYDLSDNYFSIVSPTTTPSITVISPNGGERWEIGKTYNIFWESTGITSGDKINITLVDYSKPTGLVFYDIAYNVAGNLGSYNWTIPSDFNLGEKYKIKVESCISAKCYSDESDSYFSIVSPTVGLRDIQNQLASISATISQLIEAIKRIGR